MKELYGNLWSALGGYIQSWVLPSAIGIGFFAFALLPRVEDQSPWSGLRPADAAEGALLFAFATLVVSFALAVTARPLLRLLEGYTLRPRWLKDRWTRSQRARRQQLRQQVEASTGPETTRLRVELNRFPRDALWVLPTRLGNALRAGETYGDTQYGLSVVGLWTRLVAVVDDKVTEELAQSRAVLDFFVAMMALSGALAAVTVVIAAWAGEALVLLWLILLVGLLPAWYDRAVAAVSWYGQAMEALADLGRLPLAERLGIRLNGNLKVERTVWEAVSQYAAWGPNWKRTAEWVTRIDEVLVERGAAATNQTDRQPQDATSVGPAEMTSDTDAAH